MIFAKDLKVDGLCVLFDEKLCEFHIAEENCLVNTDDEEIDMEILDEGDEIGEPDTSLLVFNKLEFMTFIKELSSLKV